MVKETVTLDVYRTTFSTNQRTHSLSLDAVDSGDSSSGTAKWIIYIALKTSATKHSAMAYKLGKSRHNKTS